MPLAPQPTPSPSTAKATEAVASPSAKSVETAKDVTKPGLPTGRPTDSVKTDPVEPANEPKASPVSRTARPIPGDPVFEQVLSHLDWDGRQPVGPSAPFSPFYVFCSQELRKQKPEFEQLIKQLQAMPATRSLGDGKSETGQAWEFKDQRLAQELEAGVRAQKPRVFLATDFVAISGTLRECRVLRSIA